MMSQHKYAKMPLTPVKDIYMNNSDTFRAMYVTEKHLLSKFIKMDEVPVDLLHSDNKSDSYK